MNSFYYVSWLAADNGHEYFAIAVHGRSGEGQLDTLVSLEDVTTGDYFGTNVVVPGVISNQTYNIEGGGLTLRATSPDLFSEVIVDCTMPEATFNLSMGHRGPSFYHSGSGTYLWGSDLTSEYAMSNLWVTGTITTNGTTAAIIPDKSRAWFDRQWGHGFAFNGWNWFVVFLDNDLTLAIWRVPPVDGSSKIDAFTTVLYPDGHHEVHLVRENIQPSGPFTSSRTNTTYFSRFDIEIPTLNTSLQVRLPRQSGEMTDATASRTLFEAYAEFTGSFKGSKVAGYGLSEQNFGFHVGP